MMTPLLLLCASPEGSGVHGMGQKAETPAYGITVGALLAKLLAYDPSAFLVVRGENGGFESLCDVESVPLRLHVNMLRDFGAHEIPGPGEKPDIHAVALLGRPLSDSEHREIGPDLTIVGGKDS